MKKTLFLFLVPLLINYGFSQWESDVRLTNNTAGSFTSFNNAWCIASTGTFVHVVWFDERDLTYAIYYKRSTNSGVNWSADTRLTNNSSNSQYPSIAVSSSVVHVVWQENRDGNWEIYHKRSTDSGVNWGADTRLTNNSSSSEYPSIAVSGSVVHVLWHDNRDGNWEIYHKRSTNSGVNWSADTRLTNFTSSSLYPSVAALDSVVHVVWQENRDGNWEIYWKRSTAWGMSWEVDTRLTNNTAESRNPSVVVSGLTVHLVWYDRRDGNPEIYYKRNLTGSPVGIKNIISELPEEFSLSQNYPNPFNPDTKFKVRVAKRSHVRIIVLDLLGREVQTLINEQLQAGTYEVYFNGENFSSGIYYYKLITEGFTETKKMLMIK